jgi:hypothetical protein
LFALCFSYDITTNKEAMSGEVKGLLNARKIKMIDIETKETKEFRSIAYAVRVTGVPEYSIRTGLNPIQKKRFEVNGRLVAFRVVK